MGSQVQKHHRDTKARGAGRAGEGQSSAWCFGEPSFPLGAPGRAAAVPQQEAPRDVSWEKVKCCRGEERATAFI